jgi:serine protease inhibitor
MDYRFVLDLHREIGSDVWSPYSIASALGLAADGAAGATRDEIAAALTTDGDLGALGKSLLLGASLEEDVEDGGIAVSNTLWADARLPVATAYQAAVRAWPGGAARTVDFLNESEAARLEINADVERTTNGLIRDLLEPRHVDSSTLAALVNALWLKVGWVGEFDPDATRPERFDAPGGPVEVPTMHRQGSMPYARTHGWTRVGVAAAGGLVADVLLPDGDLAAAERDLTPAALAELLTDQDRPEVRLSLPRFRVEAAADLLPPLMALGMRTMFSAAADFSPITGGPNPLRVTAAVHRAVLTVAESGLEGAAATALMMAMSWSPPKTPIDVRVDRPFLVLLRNRRLGVVYFVARVVRP